MNVSFEEKIVTVDNSVEYYIVKQLLFNNMLYLLGNKLINEETPSDDFYILRVDNTPDNIKIIPEQNAETLNILTNMFKDML